MYTFPSKKSFGGILIIRNSCYGIRNFIKIPYLRNTEFRFNGIRNTALRDSVFRGISVFRKHGIPVGRLSRHTFYFVTSVRVI